VRGDALHLGLGAVALDAGGLDGGVVLARALDVDDDAAGLVDAEHLVAEADVGDDDELGLGVGDVMA
jgi:hypothetical protein